MCWSSNAHDRTLKIAHGRHVGPFRLMMPSYPAPPPIQPHCPTAHRLTVIYVQSMSDGLTLDQCPAPRDQRSHRMTGIAA
jgi:hypothetical protein